MGHEETLKRIQEALDKKELTPEAHQNLKKWLTEPEFALYRDELGRMVERGEYTELQDGFYTLIPFGTGGRRGPLGLGPNRINSRTIGESAQGLANYVKNLKGPNVPLLAVIAYDTRHRSQEFAFTTADVLAANGFIVFLFDGFRSTPELSFAVRYLGADVGVVISASHNSPSDNGFKVYWSDGGQVLFPHDKRIIEKVNQVKEIKQSKEGGPPGRGSIRRLGREIDPKYWEAVCNESIFSERRELNIVYTPLHGTGTTSVVPVLEQMGYRNLHLVAEQAQPDGGFPHVKNHIPNPEEPAAFEQAIAMARDLHADLVLATDPDADRLGVAVPASFEGDHWVTLTGNQIGSLLCYFILQGLKTAQRLPQDGLVFKTLVTTDLIADIAADFGVGVIGDLLVGFKYIAEVIEGLDRSERFLFGAEESHGFLKGTYIRDKDGAVAALLIAELTEHLKREGRTPYQFLDDLYRKHGYYQESLVSFVLKGFEGKRQIDHIMKQMRTTPPSYMGGLKVFEVRDYLTGKVIEPTSQKRLRIIEKPHGDLLVFTLSPDGRTRLAVRPSGTEPKIKYYLSVYSEVPQGAGDEDLRRIKGAAEPRTEALVGGINRMAEAVLQPNLLNIQW